MRTLRPYLPVVTIAIGLLAVVVFTVRVPAPPRTVAPTIRVRWAPLVGADERSTKESTFRLRRDQLHSDRTWSYGLLDTSRDNIRSLVGDPAVEDTDGLDRAEFRITLPSVTIAERLTAPFPTVERIAGPGFREWVSRDNAWPAVLATLWLLALARPSIRAWVFCGIPVLSAVGLGLFRIVFGLGLLVVLPAATEVPAAPLSMALHRAADWFANWEWVHWLAMHPDASALVLTIATAALALFAAGVVPRTMYLVALVAITARVFVLLQHRSAHDWGLPLVALWGLSLVPWDAGLTLLPFRRQRGPNSARYGYALWLPGAVLGVGLLAAAYAKLDTNGLAWVVGGAVKYHFIEDFSQAPATWGLWIAAHPAWAVGASCAAIAVEALFILHVFLPHPLARGLAGVAALSLLAGFYLFQGVFWPQWWVLLLVLLPWEWLARVLSPVRATVSRSAPFPRPIQVALVGLLVSVQVFASARRVEVEPFVSDYGMYAWTWTSIEAFDRHIARKYRAYRYTVEESGATVDVTARVRALPSASDALTDAVDQFRDGRDLSAAQREALRAVAAMYQSAFNEPPSRLTVLLDEQAFDWTRARFYQKLDGERIALVDLSAGILVSAPRVNEGS